MDIKLKELLKNDFGIDFPISGGTGNSIDNPIVIHRTGSNDYTATEYAILRCLGIGRRIDWKLLRQSLIHQNGKVFDQMKIETRMVTEDEIITCIENYYFDITECFGQ